jgi:glycosyltransferase involved in cell wall biosynthesis
MKILISTGIYPPDIGGPAQYARNLYETWKNDGHDVKVCAFRWERAFPPIIRNLLFLTKVWRKGWNADLILVLDTWSAAVPTMLACKFMRKKYIVRTGGDFLWESYVERTGDMVLFREFYNKAKENFTAKERLVRYLTQKVLKNAKKIIFSTEWQRKIFEKEYGLDSNKSVIVENYYGKKVDPINPENRSFVGGTRFLKWKNLDVLKESFDIAKNILAKSKQNLPIDLDTGVAYYDNFFEKIRRSYAVILVSLGDISPNMIMDSIRAGVPFICTRETGIYDRIKDIGIFVDPKDPKDIANKIVWLADSNNRDIQAQKVLAFNFTHTWAEVSKDILNVWNNVKR